MDPAGMANEGPTSTLGRIVLALARLFRTPLASIEGAGWMLDDPKLEDSKRKEFIRIIRKECHRLDRILSDLSEFAQPRGFAFRTFSALDVVDGVVQLAKPRNNGSPEVIDLDIQPDLPPLRGDPEQIQRVLLNLVLNSIQARAGRIEISAGVEGENAVFRVKDNGTGIPESIRDQIFDPFFTTRDNGLGLGLPVASRIVAGHGGKISVEEHPDCGACLAVFLPLAGPATR